jgi:YVTN family beta-propeller protein
MWRAIAGLLLLLGTAAGAAGQSPVQPLGRAVLVVNSGEASLSVIDLATHTERGRIPVLREPHHVALTPDGHDLLLGDTVANELLFLDPHDFTIRRRMPMADPYQLGFSPDGKLLVVNGLARNQVDVYDSRTYQLLHRFPAKAMPSHMDFAPDSSVVYITLQKTSRLMAIDLRRNVVLWEKETGRTPAGVMWWGGRLLVACMDTDKVDVIDPATGDVERRITAGRGAHQVFRSPDGKLVYVNSRVDSTITALDGATLKVVRTYKVPGGPDDLIIAPDGHIWASLRFVGKVAILDPATGAIQTLAVGRSPHGINLGTP